jgi:hypothetical protein
VRIQLRHRLVIATPTPLAWRKAASRQPICEVALGSPESLARGMLSKGLPVNLGELPTTPELGSKVQPKPESNQGLREARASPGKRTNPRRGVPATKGDQRRQERVGEQSYDLIVPGKVGNRRAPERGGHGTHWREGVNR